MTSFTKACLVTSPIYLKKTLLLWLLLVTITWIYRTLPPQAQTSTIPI